MSKKLEVTPSELVLSSIFFLQQKNGVSAKDITKFICKKWGCKQSAVTNEVKEALDKAVESGIFTKKQALYRIDDSLGNDLNLIKKRMAESSPKNDHVSEAQEEMQDSSNCFENVDDQWLTSRSSKSERISLEQLDLLRSKAEEDDDEEDFLEDEDDELDFFEDDPVPEACNLKKGGSTPSKSKACMHHHHHQKRRRGRKGRTKSKKKRSKSRKKPGKRTKMVCSCENIDSSVNVSLKSSETLDTENEDDEKEDPEDNVPRKQKNIKKNNKPGERSNNYETNKGRKGGKKSKKAAEYLGDHGDDSNCNVPQGGQQDNQCKKPQDGADTVSPTRDEMKKNLTDEQSKGKGNDGKKSEEPQTDKTGGDAPKNDVNGNTVKANGNTNEVRDRDWHKKKNKRKHSPSLFGPVKKKFSPKDKPTGEQRGAKKKYAK